MARNPQYKRPLTDSTKFGVIHGNNQDIFPIYLSEIKDFIVGSVPVLPTFTQGSVLFAGPGGAISGDANSNFFWDNTNSRLGIGTTSPSTALDVNGIITTKGLTATSAPIDAQGDFRARSSIKLDAYAPVSGHNLLIVGTDGSVFTRSENYYTTQAWVTSQGYQTAGDVATIIANDVDKAFIDALNVDADTLDGQDGTYYLAWNNLTGVPSTFTPSAHTHDAGDITSGTFADARIPNLSASKITSGTFADARIASAANWNTAYNYSQVGHIPNSQKGSANGVASLDGNGKVPLTQINDSIIGQVEYKGLWNASTNTPTLPTTPTEKGHYYIVNTVGTQFGINFEVGDWIISDGLIWSKVDNTDAVSSVFGRTGNISAVEADYQSFYPRLSQSYVNPTWVSSLAWSKLTGVPSTFTPSAHTHTTSEITNLSSYTGFDARYYTETEINNKFSGASATTGYNKTNWDTAYTYSQVGHLPLTGGTLTGDLVIASNGSIPDSTTATYTEGLTITGGNQRLVIDTSSTSDGGSYIQTRNASTSFPSNFYTLSLNPLGGNVGIGTTSTSAKLHVVGSGTTAATYTALFHNSTNANNALVIRDDGAIGLGILPISPYQVTVNNDIYAINGFKTGSSTTFVGQVYNNSGTFAFEAQPNRDIKLGSVNFPNSIFIEGTNGNVGFGTSNPSALLSLTNDDNTTISGLNLTNSGGTIYGGLFKDSTTETVKLFAQRTNGEIILGNITDSMLYVGTGTANPYYRNIGIGTTTPLGIVHANKQSVGAQTTAIFQNDSATDSLGSVALKFTQGTDGFAGKIVSGRSGNYGAANANRNSYLAFFTALNNVDTERVRITNEGNVGIGTNTPKSRVHIVGPSMMIGDNVSANTIKTFEVLAESYDVNEQPMTVFRTFTGSSSSSLQIGGFAGGVNRVAQEIRLLSGNFGDTGTTSGAVKFKLDSSGNIVIANAAQAIAAAARLHVHGAGTTSSTYTAQFHNSTGTSNSLMIRDDGRVGIGTNAPAKTLSVEGDIRVTSGLFEIFGGTVYPQLSRDGGSGGFLINTIGTVSSAASLFSVRNNGGTDYLSILGSGNVGIGTSSPDEKLEVYQGNIKLGTDTNTTSKLIFERSAAIRAELYVGSSNQLQFDLAGSERMRIDSSGNVGIGTTSPLTNLDITGGSGSTIVPLLNISQEGDLGANWSAGGINFYSRDTSTTSSGGIGGIRMYAEASYNTGTTPSYMSFFTHDNIPNNGTVLGATTEKMRITSSGNVGIGKTTAEFKLDIDGSAMISRNNYFYIDNLDNAHFGGIIWRNADSSRTTTAKIDVAQEGTFARKALTFFTKSVGDWTTPAAERMRITTNGNILIGNTTGAARLHVVGAGTTSSTFTAQFHNSTGTSNSLTIRDDGLVSASSLAIPSLTEGSVLFAGAGGVISEDNSKFNYLNDRLSIRANAGGSGVYRGYSTATGIQTIFYSGIAVPNANLNGAFHDTYTNTDVAPDFMGRVGFRFQGGINTPSRQYQVYVGEASTPKLIINGSGNLGLGTGFLSPSARLHLAGAGATSATYTALFHNSTGTNNALVIRDDGFVGFSTAVPTAKIDINSTTAGEAMLQLSRSDTSKGLRFVNYTGAGSFNLEYSNNLSTWNTFASFNITFGGSSPALGLNNASPQEALHVTGNLRLGLNGSTGYYIDWGQDAVSSSGSFARIQGIRTNATGNQAGDLVFYTKERITGGVTPDERMRINEYGNVGIGTTTPSARLHVSGDTIIQTTSGTQPFRVFDTTTGYKSFNVNYTAAFTTNLNFGGFGNIDYDGNGGVMKLRNASFQAGSSYMYFTMGSTDAMYINSSFDVGIGLGTTVASARVHIKGSGTTSGTNALLIENSAATQLLKVADDGNVLIGPTPTGGAFIRQLNITSEGFANSQWSSFSNTGSPFISLNRARGTLASPSGLLNGDTIATIAASSYHSGGGFAGSNVALNFIATENQTATAHGSGITFNTVINGGTSRTERARFSGAGNFLIGTTTDAARLTVVGAGTSAATYTAQFHNSTGANNALVIRDDGRVGIGTSAPNNALHVEQTGTFYQARIRGASPNNSGGLTIQNDSPQSLNIEVTGTTEGSNPSSAIISTSGGLTKIQLGASRSSPLFTLLTSSGNVGIGTTNPDHKLHVVSSAQCPALFVSTTAGGGIALMDSTTTNDAQVGIGAFGNNLCFRSGGSTAGNMRLLANGNFGIGTTTPSARLHVVGAGASSATYTAQFHNSTGSNNALVIRDDNTILSGTASIYQGAGEFNYTRSGNANHIIRSTAGIANAYIIGATQSILRINTSTGNQWFWRTVGTNIDLVDGTWNNNVVSITPRGRQTHTLSYNATANNDYGWNFTGTLTARATASDTLNGVLINPTLVASAANQGLVGIQGNITVSEGAHAGVIAYPILLSTNYSGSVINSFANNGTGTNSIRLAAGGGNVTLGRNNGANGSASIVQSGTGSFSIVISSSKTEFNNSGDLSLGLAFSGTPISARLHVRGAGTTSATNVAAFQNGSANTVMNLRDDGLISMGETLETYMYPVSFSAPTTPDASNSQGFVFAKASTSSGWNNGGYRFYGDNHTPDINESYLVGIDANFAPPSGSSTFHLLHINPTINQVGGANGITRGLYVNPDLAAAADWRSIETSNNTGYAFYAEGTAPSLFNGKVDLNATNGYDQLRLRNSYTPTGTADPNGSTGDTAWDDNYFYLKTILGWKRTALAPF